MFGDEVAEALSVIRNEKKQYKDYLPQEAIDAGVNMVDATRNLWEDVQSTIMELVRQEIPMQYPHVAVWWYSVLLGIRNDRDIFLDMVRYLRKNRRVFSANTQYFIYYQLKFKLFVSSKLDMEESKAELWEYFREVVEEFAQVLTTPLEAIPEEERNKNLVVVITEQVTNTKHGPTKTALDRCKALMTVLGKEVLLINTAEVTNVVGCIPLYDTRLGTYNKKILLAKELEWKGVKVPYLQCEQNMPDIDTLNELLGKIRRLAPGRVVSIGGSGMLSNLVNKMIPVLTVGLAPSDLEITTTKYQTLSRRLQDSDIHMLQKLGFSEDHVVESIFTSSLKPQTEHITRAELGIPDDKFVMFVIGYRLNEEVTDEFLQTIEEVMEKDMLLGFLGRFGNYQECISKYPKLKEQSVFFGDCEDILSRMEICDLYVNPIRKGGGTSCVEAMFKGVPVVSVAYGDVAVNVGEDFLVKDYAGMQDVIKRYHDEKDFYQVMSQKAEKRAEILLDTETEFARIMAEVDKREGR